MGGSRVDIERLSDSSYYNFSWSASQALDDSITCAAGARVCLHTFTRESLGVVGWVIFWLPWMNDVSAVDGLELAPPKRASLRSGCSLLLSVGHNGDIRVPLYKEFECSLYSKMPRQLSGREGGNWLTDNTLLRTTAVPFQEILHLHVYVVTNMYVHVRVGSIEGRGRESVPQGLC